MAFKEIWGGKDLGKPKIETAKEYNRKAKKEYEEMAKQGNGYPSELISRPEMFMFFDEKTEEPKKTGFVLTYERSKKWFKTKKEALKELKKVI
jgi:hypothetical protein